MACAKWNMSITCHHILVPTVIILTVLAFIRCGEDKREHAPAIDNRDSLPLLRSQGVSTLISDSGIITYKIIAEDWFVYDKKNPPRWSFEKGLYLEKYDKDYHVDAFITCDTAYYYYQNRLWELRGRVFAKNPKGEFFRTEKLFWDQRNSEFYSDQHMIIKGETQELEGNRFRSNEKLTVYSIEQSSGKFPLQEEQQRPVPDPQKMREYADTTQDNSAKESLLQSSGDSIHL